MMAARQSNAMLLCNQGRLLRRSKAAGYRGIRKSFARLGVSLRRLTGRAAGLVFVS